MAGINRLAPGTLPFADALVLARASIFAAQGVRRPCRGYHHDSVVVKNSEKHSGLTPDGQNAARRMIWWQQAAHCHRYHLQVLFLYPDDRANEDKRLLFTFSGTRWIADLMEKDDEKMEMPKRSCSCAAARRNVVVGSYYWPVRSVTISSNGRKAPEIPSK